MYQNLNKPKLPLPNYSSMYEGIGIKLRKTYHAKMIFRIGVCIIIISLILGIILGSVFQLQTIDISRSSSKIIESYNWPLAIGIVVVGLLATVLHSTMLAPIPVLGLILAVLVLLTNKGHFAHTVENIEKAMFFITFIVIICSFILLYKPI